MAQEPPAAVVNFHDMIRDMNIADIKQLPQYIDLRPENRLELVRCKPPSMKWRFRQETYYKVQEAFWDYVGRCGMCQESRHGNNVKHVHGIQATAGSEVEGFPGLIVFPRLLHNGLVYRQLLDDLLHNELGRPWNLTSVAQHDTAKEIELPDPKDADTSVFRRNLAQTTAYLTGLREIRLGDDSQCKDKTKKMLESILPLNVGEVNAHMSSAEHARPLKQMGVEPGVVLDISLGCAAIMLVALPKQDGIFGTEDNADWRDLIHEFNSDDDDPDNSDSERSTEYDMVLLHLRPTDGVVFAGSSLRAWYGISKVLGGSAGSWENDWPAWFEDAEDTELQRWKGCMKGKRVDLVIR